MEVSVPQLNSNSKVPVCNWQEEGDGSKTFIRIMARDENNVEWVIDTKGGVWEEGPFFYSASTDPIPIGRYTVYEVSYFSGGVVRYGIPDLLEAELLSQFNPTAVPFYLDIEEGGNYLSLTLFCFYEVEETVLGELDEVDGHTFQWRNISVYLTEVQRSCVEKIRVSFESGPGDVVAYLYDPKDYPIDQDSPITVIPAINSSIIKIGLIANDMLVEQKIVGFDYADFNWEAPLQFEFDCTIEIGDFLFGGIVYYIFQPGDPGYEPNATHGLVAAPVDQSDGIQWSKGEILFVETHSFFGGLENTVAIVNALGPGDYAASICYNLELNGYADWWLPSAGELYLMCVNIGLAAPSPNTNLGGFSANTYYWSSTIISASAIGSPVGLFVDECATDEPEYSQDQQFYVRAVRAF